MKLKKGDTVLITAGKEKGRKVKITKTLPQADRVVLDGANIKKRHKKPRKAGEKGQIIEIAAPFAASNVMVICSKCSKPTRIGIKIEGKKKYRMCKKCGAEME